MLLDSTRNVRPKLLITGHKWCVTCCEQKITNNEQKSYEQQANITNNGDNLEQEPRVNISKI